MTYGQVGAVCPQCGSAAGVHSIQELASMAQGQLNTMQGYLGAQGNPGAPQPGMNQPGMGQPEAGQPGAGQPGAGQAGAGQQGWTQEPQASGGQQPGWAQEPASGPLRGPAGWRGRARNYDNSSIGDGIMSSIEDDIAGAALGAAAKFIGRAISRKMQAKMNDQVLPAVAARGQDNLRRQVEIAQRHPDLRACMNDKVVFLAGGTRTVPLQSINMAMTVEQSDALVAQLRS